ncbi:uncharacterized protein LOC133317603 [Gastrolobium bilobum]|uniref:uncharacterized protein LOC133317603 n=1 Tax=Gastrolobium bilobum TaxID=150636 RepID=UPI002AB20E5D|nr:uncharacterized protein LOC133317603 [Gastrolobium bilobum]
MQKEEQDINKEYLDSLLCPSFNSYTTERLASIADQVGRDHYVAQNDNAFNHSQNDDTDFEFVAFREVVDHEVFFDDTVFPLFNRDLLMEHRSSVGVDGARDSTVAALRFPMAKLLIGGGKRNPVAQSSESSSEAASEAVDLEGVPAGTYCVWTPNSPQASPNRCKKSNSTGSSSTSKRWKLLDLLRRSNSDRKDSFVFLTPSPSTKKMKEQWSSGSIKVAGRSSTNGFGGNGREKKVAVSAHEALYVRNRDLGKWIRKDCFCRTGKTSLGSAQNVWESPSFRFEEYA